MNSPEVIFEGGMLNHGAFGEYATTEIVRYHFEKFEDEDGENGFIQILGFPDPPVGKPYAVLHYYSNKTGHSVFNFPSVEAVCGFHLTQDVRRMIDGELPVRKELSLERHGTDLPWFFSPIGVLNEVVNS